MSAEDIEGRFDKAAELISAGIKEARKIGKQLGEDFPALTTDSPSFLHMLIALTPGIEAIIPAEDRIHYRVEDELAQLIAGLAGKEPWAAAILRQISRSNIAEGEPLPRAFRPHVSLLVGGEDCLARRQGSMAAKSFFWAWFWRDGALLARDAFELKLTRGDDKAELSACDVVVLAAGWHRIDLKYEALRDWCTHKKNARFRSQADAFTNAMKDEALVQWGALSRRDPRGPIWELVRMTP